VCHAVDRIIEDRYHILAAGLPDSIAHEYHTGVWVIPDERVPRQRPLRKLIRADQRMLEG
jgi:hypothetical protein